MNEPDTSITSFDLSGIDGLLRDDARDLARRGVAAAIAWESYARSVARRLEEIRTDRDVARRDLDMVQARLEEVRVALEVERVRVDVLVGIDERMADAFAAEGRPSSSPPRWAGHDAGHDSCGGRR